MVKKSAKKKARVQGIVKDDIVREISKINRIPSLAELNKLSQKRSNSSSSRGSSGHAMTKAHNSIGSALSKLTNSTVSEIVAGMALPCDHPTKRIKIGYSSDPTGVAQPFVSFSYNATAVSVAGGNAGYGSILMFRDVLRATATFYPDTAAYTYNIYFNNPSLTEGFTLTYKWAEATVNPLPMAYALSSGGEGPHGSTLYCGEHEGRLGIFMNYEETITFTGGSAAYQLVVYYLSGQRWQLVTVISSSGTPAVAAYANTAGSSISGYYAFEIAQVVSTSAESTISAVLTTSANQDVWGFAPIPNVNNKATSFTGIRVNAASCLMSCTASDLNANGTIVAAQFNSSYDWARTMNAGFDNILADISSTSSNYAGPAKNGCYGFLKPSNAADFDFQMPFMVDATSEAVTSYNFKIVSPSPMMWFVFQTGLTSSSYPGSEFQVTQHWGVEFTTYDPWYEKLPCYLSASVFEQAMTALSQIQQFHENKVHWKDILAQIKKFAMITPEILGLLSTAVPQLRPAALIAGGIKGYFKG